MLLITGQKNLRSSFAEGYQKLPNTCTVKVTDYLLTLRLKVAGEIINTITLCGEMTWLWLLFSSPFWSFHLPMTAKWSFTVNLHFLYNDFFFFFLLIFQLPQAQKVKLFSITFQSSPELTNHACLHGLVRSVLFMTSEMVFLLGLQEPEVGQEQKDPQTWLSTSPLPNESHQKALWWPLVWGWICAQPFC